MLRKMILYIFLEILHLHGHIHSKGDYNLQQKSDGILRYDVGVDANEFYPVSIEQVKDFMGI